MGHKDNLIQILKIKSLEIHAVYVKKQKTDHK